MLVVKMPVTSDKDASGFDSRRRTTRTVESAPEGRCVAGSVLRFARNLRCRDRANPGSTVPQHAFPDVAALSQQDGGEDACYFVEHRALRRSWVQIPPVEMP